MSASGRALGAAAELAFQAECLLRGIGTSVPTLDMGIDLYCNGAGVQIKASREAVEARRVTPRYSFNMKGMGNRTSWDDFNQDVKALVFVGVTQTGRFRYWIVPLAELRKRRYTSVLRLTSTPGRQAGEYDFLREYEDAWHVLG